MNSREKIFLIAWVILPSLILNLFGLNSLWSVLLYFVLPSCYFSARVPKLVPKALILGFATIPFVVIFDYIAFFNNSWVVPSIFEYRFLSLIPLEDFLWTFWAVYAVVMAYYYFFDRHNRGKLNAFRIKRFFVLAAAFLAVFFLIFLIKPVLFEIPYFYFWLVLAVFVIIPLFISWAYSPAYLKHITRISLYSFVLMILYELTALQLGYWSFTSIEYVGLINLGGKLIFPIEEFFTWMVLFPHAALAFSEFISE